MSAATLEWVHRRENFVVCEQSGTGKTFLLEALGQHAVEQGRRVAWFTLEELGVLLRRHRVVDAAYEKRSVAAWSNLHPASFDERTTRHWPQLQSTGCWNEAYVCQTSGESVRLSQALAGDGVTPLDGTR